MTSCQKFGFSELSLFSARHFVTIGQSKGFRLGSPVLGTPLWATLVNPTSLLFRELGDPLGGVNSPGLQVSSL